MDGDAAACDLAAADAEQRGQEASVVEAWRRLAEQARAAKAAPLTAPPLTPVREADGPAPEPSSAPAPARVKAAEAKSGAPSLSGFVRPGALGRTPLRLGAELAGGLAGGLVGAVLVGAAVFVPAVVILGITHLLLRAIFGNLFSGPSVFAVAWDLALPAAGVGALAGLAVGAHFGGRLLEKAALSVVPTLVAAVLGAVGGTIATVALYRMMNVTNPFVHPVLLWLPPLLPIPIAVLLAAVIGTEIGVALRVAPSVAVLPGGVAFRATARF